MDLSENWRHFAAGAVAGSSGVFVGHPFETVKVQFQVQAPHNQYRGIKDCLVAIHKQGMAKGFFRGLSWPLFSYGLINSVFFGLYGSILDQLKGDKSTTKPDYIHIYLAGCISGFFQLIPSCPCEVIKVVLQSQIPHGTDKHARAPQNYYSGPMEGAIDIIRKRGLLGMYRGFSINAVRDVPSNGIYFLVFEYLSYEGNKTFSELPSQFINFMSGGFAGVLSWAAIMPFDVVKSRMQADSGAKQYKNMLDCALQSYQHEGFRVFFKGLFVTSIRAFPVNAVILLVYTDTLKYLTLPKMEAD